MKLDAERKHDEAGRVPARNAAPPSADERRVGRSREFAPQAREESRRDRRAAFGRTLSSREIRIFSRASRRNTSSSAIGPGHALRRTLHRDQRPGGSAPGSRDGVPGPRRSTTPRSRRPRRPKADTAAAACPTSSSPRFARPAGTCRAPCRSSIRSKSDRRAAGEGPISDVAAYRGDLLARMGRNREAEEAFRQELRYFPNNPRAWTGLAMLYASEGQGSQARDTLEGWSESRRRRGPSRPRRRPYQVLGDPSDAKRVLARARAGRRKMRGKIKSRGSATPRAGKGVDYA